MKVVSTKNKGIEEEFKEKLKKFVEDNSLLEGYGKYTPMGDEVIIQLFKFIPEDRTEEEKKNGLGEVLAYGQISGKLKSVRQAVNEKILPFVKVLKVGLGVTKKIEAGELFTVSPDDIVGSDWNPAFLHLANTFQKSQGTQGKLVNVPEDMPQRIPKLDKNWARYKFFKPDVLKDEDQDDLVFVIPALLLKTKVDV